MKIKDKLAMSMLTKTLASIVSLYISHMLAQAFRKGKSLRNHI
jgi:hypothetical protein